MGIAQRRITSGYEEKQYAKWKKEFNTIVGFDIPIDIKWDTLQNDDYEDADKCAEWFDMVYFNPLRAVFAELCSDDMGKKAVKAGVKKIIIDGTDGARPEASTFEKGVFKLNHKFYSNVDAEADRTKKWTKMIGDEL